MSVRILTKLKSLQETRILEFNLPKRTRAKSDTDVNTSKELCPPKSMWNIFGKKGKKEAETCKRKDDKPTEKECEVMREMLRMEEPDLTPFGGVPYRTCNPNAFVIQKDRLPPIEIKVDPEDKMVEKIERHPSIKDVVDPMPPFVSVEQRMIDLCEKKMHPLYKKYLFAPRKPNKESRYTLKYKGKCSAPPSNLEILKTKIIHFDKKNIYVEFKRMERFDEAITKMPQFKINPKTTEMIRLDQHEDESGQRMEELRKCQRKVCSKGV